MILLAPSSVSEPEEDEFLELEVGGDSPNGEEAYRTMLPTTLSNFFMFRENPTE